MFFLDNVVPGNVAGQIDRGVMTGAARREDSAEVGREHSQWAEDAVVGLRRTREDPGRKRRWRLPDR